MPRRRAHSANYDAYYNLHGVLFSKTSSEAKDAPECLDETEDEWKYHSESSPLIVHENDVRNDEEKQDVIEVENATKNVTRKARLAFRSLPSRKKYVFILCTMTYFMEGCGFSLLAPFFPQEAYDKGMSPTLTGFVFSVFELMIFITSPIFGSYLTQLGPKFVVLAGVFIAGMCNILFGTLDLCPPGTPFIVISILCRSVEAIGFSSYVTALMAIVITEFPSEATTTFAILESANGVGMMVGPAIGGVLYEIGGFGLPFYVIGAFILLNGIFVYVIIPEPHQNPRVRDKKIQRSKLSIFRSPMVVIAIVSICIGCLGEAFLEPVLANHLENFDISVVVIGLFFVIAPFVYTVFAPLWGFLTDRKGFYRQLIIVGHFMFGLGFLFIGPSELLPFLPFKMWTVVIGLVLQGSFFGCCLIPTMKCMLIGAKDVGFEENMETFAIVSGLLNSMYSLGAFLGPMVGGVLVEEVGGQMAFTIVGLSSIAMGFASLIFFLVRHSRCADNVKKGGYEILP